MILEGPEPQTDMIAIDPGETCGVALFDGTRCWQALPMASDGCLHFLEAMLQRQSHVDAMLRGIAPIREVVVERFRLYASKARQQTGSSFRTVEVIGVIKWLCHLADIPCILVPADIKNATAGNMRGRGIQSVAQGENSTVREHAKDAEQLGYYRLFETKRL